MIIKNVSGVVLLSDVKVASDFLSRLFGMLFVNPEIGPSAIWFPNCNSIHMLFMRFPLDLIFLNRNRKIVKIAMNVRPWTPVVGCREAESVLELIPGTWDPEQFRVGESLSFLK